MNKTHADSTQDLIAPKFLFESEPIRDSAGQLGNLPVQTSLFGDFSRSDASHLRIQPAGMPDALGRSEADSPMIDFSTASFLSEKVCRERAEVAMLVSQQSRYPRPPDIMRKAWESLVPAILELANHLWDENLTLLQSVKNTKKIKGAGRQAVDPSRYKARDEVLDYWLYDVLVLIGTLPIETSEASDRFVTAGAARSVDDDQEPIADEDKDGGISAQSRNEAMMCLELLCVKVWYARHREGRNEIQIRAMLFSCLQFLYWETGVPTALSMLLDVNQEYTDEVFDEVRRYNYRQLYSVQEQGLFPNLISRVGHGVTALAERREAFARRFDKWLHKDSRWAKTFSDHCETVTQKYNTLTIS